MELNLQPLSDTCFVSGERFNEGDRVISLLVRGDTGEITRRDMKGEHQAQWAPDETVICRWAHRFKPRKSGENPERALKMSAESLFLTLAAPEAERSDENDRLIQVLALMLERKRVLRPKGPLVRSPWVHQPYEHIREKTVYEVPQAELSPEFFLSIQEQLAALIGGGES